jgi:hypothetical protein
LSQSDTAKIGTGLGVCALLVCIAMAIAWLSSAAPATPIDHDHVQARKDEDDPGENRPSEELLTHHVDHVYIGRDYDNFPRKRDTLLTTRQGSTTFQVLLRYTDKLVDLKDVPCINEIIQEATKQGRQLPNSVHRVDEETEQFSRNLGQSVRLLTSYHAFIDPTDKRVMAYDLAQTTGGVAQRYVGYRTAKGVKVNLYRGNDRIDQHEVTFQDATTLMPLDYSFIHFAFNDDPEALARRTEKYRHVFLPGQNATVGLLAKPMGDEVIPIKNLNHLCSRYRVRVHSVEFPDGPRAYQDMWFEKSSGIMMRREDVEPTLQPGQAPVTELAQLESFEETLQKLGERVLTPPRLPDKPFPYMIDTEMTFNIRARDADIGRVRMRFVPASASGGTFAAHAAVIMNPGGNARNESAVTFFDEKFNTIKYSADGNETGEVVADYKLSALQRNNTVEVSMQREVKPRPETILPDQEPSPEKPTKPAPVVRDYKDPLKRVPIEDDEESPELAALPPLTTYTHTRNLSNGTCLYDFNRIEHLAAIAYRFPMPPKPAPDVPITSTFQKVAIYSVRQNRADIVQFEIKPEIKPVLTERQRRRLDPRDRDEPQLYIATSTHSLLNSRMLLTEHGRILQLTVNQGTGDVTYTLDDPIMRRREELARRQRMQEGPQLLRPPWW